MAQTIFHQANTRGHANHGWLNAHHSFSFASYQDRTRMHFGVLRVLNDDEIGGKMGFGMHPHDNMEIITIPLVGELVHKDSMGNSAVIHAGQIQVMSAGTGITHSEFNNTNETLKLLQIWLFPKEKNVIPRYDELTLNVADRINKFQQILSPNKNDEGVWIHQDAWFSIGKFNKDKIEAYTIKKQNNGVYIFIISGSVMINEQLLNTRDGFGIWDTDTFNINILEDNAEILLMDIPMELPL